MEKEGGLMELLASVIKKIAEASRQDDKDIDMDLKKTINDGESVVATSIEADRDDL